MDRTQLAKDSFDTALEYLNNGEFDAALSMT